jgi:hypothetical protein
MANPLSTGQVLALSLTATLGAIAISPSVVAQDAFYSPPPDGAETRAQSGEWVLPLSNYANWMRR